MILGRNLFVTTISYYWWLPFWQS